MSTRSGTIVGSILVIAAFAVVAVQLLGTVISWATEPARATLQAGNECGPEHYWVRVQTDASGLPDLSCEKFQP